MAALLIAKSWFKKKHSNSGNKTEDPVYINTTSLPSPIPGLSSLTLTSPTTTNTTTTASTGAPLSSIHSRNYMTSNHKITKGANKKTPSNNSTDAHKSRRQGTDGYDFKENSLHPHQQPARHKGSGAHASPGSSRTALNAGSGLSSPRRSPRVIVNHSGKTLHAPLGPLPPPPIPSTPSTPVPLLTPAPAGADTSESGTNGRPRSRKRSNKGEPGVSTNALASLFPLGPAPAYPSKQSSSPRSRSGQDHVPHDQHNYTTGRHWQQPQPQQQPQVYHRQPETPLAPTAKDTLGKAIKPAIFRNLSTRFTSSTDTLPVVETVAQEYARTIKALWRMAEEEELSHRMAAMEQQHQQQLQNRFLDYSTNLSMGCVSYTRPQTTTPHASPANYFGYTHRRQRSQHKRPKGAAGYLDFMDQQQQQAHSQHHHQQQVLQQEQQQHNVRSQHTYTSFPMQQHGLTYGQDPYQDRHSSDYEDLLRQHRGSENRYTARNVCRKTCCNLNGEQDEYGHDQFVGQEDEEYTQQRQPLFYPEYEPSQPCYLLEPTHHAQSQNARTSTHSWYSQTPCSGTRYNQNGGQDGDEDEDELNEENMKTKRQELAKLEQDLCLLGLQRYQNHEDIEDARNTLSLEQERNQHQSGQQLYPQWYEHADSSETLGETSMMASTFQNQEHHQQQHHLAKHPQQDLPVGYDRQPFFRATCESLEEDEVTDAEQSAWERLQDEDGDEGVAPESNRLDSREHLQKHQKATSPTYSSPHPGYQRTTLAAKTTDIQPLRPPSESDSLIINELMVQQHDSSRVLSTV